MDPLGRGLCGFVPHRLLSFEPVEEVRGGSIRSDERCDPGDLDAGDVVRKRLRDQLHHEECDYEQTRQLYADRILVREALLQERETEPVDSRQ